MITLIRYWYFESAGRFYAAYLHTARALEDQISIQETLKHMNQPLFQDYTYQGRLIGIALRLVRIGVGVFALILLTLAYLFFYIFWLFFPIICVVSIIASVAAPNIATPITSITSGL
jgi:hypothetical protein